jgi:hypothetical protein
MNPGWIVTPEITFSGGSITNVPLNYSQNIQTSPTTIYDGTPLPATIISATIVTRGANPVQVIVSGDANRTNSGGGWGKLQLYRGDTPIGNIVQFESTEANINVPYSLELIDDNSLPSGEYTYSLKLIAKSSGAEVQFGEVNGPVLSLIELQTGISGGGGGGTGSTIGSFLQETTTKRIMSRVNFSSFILTKDYYS